MVVLVGACLSIVLMLVVGCGPGGPSVEDVNAAPRSSCSIRGQSGDVTATLTWQDTDVVDLTTISRSTTSGSGYQAIATVPGNDLTYKDVVTVPHKGITYYYVVSNQNGQSNEVCKAFQH